MDKKSFYLILEKLYSEEEIQIMMNIVCDIEDNHLSAKKAYDLVKGMKVKDVNIVLAMAFFEEKINAMTKLSLAEKKIIQDTIVGYKKALRNNTINEFFKDYTSEDFYFLEHLIEEDYRVLNEDEKELYINEIRYLNGEIESAIPKVKVRKKKIPNLEEE